MTTMGCTLRLAPLEPFWGEGQMTIVQSTGYEGSSRSHFEETTSWVTASGTGSMDRGWMGRYLQDVAERPFPNHPPAVRFGGSGELFRADGEILSMTFDQATLDRLEQSGGLFPVEGIPDTAMGEALTYVREVANASVRFAEPVQQAAEQGSNKVAYPTYGNNSREKLGNGLASIARLIRGGLQTRVYLVPGSGTFDTHANQASTHALRMQEISEAVSAFYADLADDGLDERVLTMTFSEFGRTIHENGSAGTDHGAGSSLFLFGPAVAGGFVGQAPDLSDVYNSGVRPTTDYRSVYRSVLEQWFDVAPDATEAVLGGTFPLLEGLVTPPPGDGPGVGTTTQTIELEAGWSLMSSYVRPSNPSLEAIVHPISEALLLVKDEDGRIYSPELGLEDLATWSAEQAYHVYVNEACTLAIEGLVVNAATTPLALSAGWNHIPYILDEPMSAATAFDALGDSCLLIKDDVGRLYSPLYGITDLEVLMPGRGYHVYMEQAAEFVYPAPDGATPPASDSVVLGHFRSPPASPTQATLICTVPSGLSLQEVAARTPEGQTVGAGRVRQDTVAVTLAGIDPQIAKAHGAEPGVPLSLVGWDAAARTEVALRVQSVADEPLHPMHSEELRFQPGTLKLVTIDGAAGAG